MISFSAAAIPAFSAPRSGSFPAKTGAELLFDVVSRTDERTSLIVTTNLPFEQWIEVLGSQRLTGAFWID